MLNLLVAIISKIFEEINENSIAAMYQERACIIAENGYLIPWYRKKQLCENRNQYLIVARDLLDEDNDKDGVEAVQQKLGELETSISDFKKDFRDAHDELATTVTTIAQAVESMKK